MPGAYLKFQLKGGALIGRSLIEGEEGVGRLLFTYTDSVAEQKSYEKSGDRNSFSLHPYYLRNCIFEGAIV